MDQIEKETLYNAAWKHWGADTQIDILIEEMAEFIQAILKTRRNHVTYSYSFYEEMADTLICLEQIETRLKQYPKGGGIKNTGKSEWDHVIEIKEMKLNRLKNRLIQSMKEKHEGVGETWQ